MEYSLRSFKDIVCAIIQYIYMCMYWAFRSIIFVCLHEHSVH